MLSFHERWFERRWYGFRPRTKRVAVISFLTFVTCMGLAFALADEHAWAPWLAAPVVVVFLINAALGLGRTDW